MEIPHDTSSAAGRGRRVRPVVAAALVVASLGAGVGVGRTAWPARHAAAADVAPALVDVNVSFNYQQASGAGTGIVLTSTGEILTNNHVISGATAINVTDIGNGRTYPATVVGYDSAADVAVLHLSGASGLRTARLADSSKVTVGQAVIAIGNAGGSGGAPSAAAGSVTALGQAITAGDSLTGESESLTGLIETDAAIQSGDSGGSLVNASGQVIGMDTAASSGYALRSQRNQGYAIPINRALSIVRQVESGRSTPTVHVGPTAFLGVLLSPDSTSVSGAVVSAVVPGGAVQQAGMVGGDVITSLGGRNVATSSDLSGIVGRQRPGDVLQVGWTDQAGRTRTSTLTLGTGPAQ